MVAVKGTRDMREAERQGEGSIKMDWILHRILEWERRRRGADRIRVRSADCRSDLKKKETNGAELSKYNTQSRRAKGGCK